MHRARRHEGRVKDGTAPSTRAPHGEELASHAHHVFQGEHMIAYHRNRVGRSSLRRFLCHVESAEIVDLRTPTKVNIAAIGCVVSPRHDVT